MKTFLLALFASLQLCAASSYAQSSKPVSIIVPFAVGGPTDIIARILAPKLAASLKRPVIVDNKVGATGGIGAAFVAKAPPDGDTLLLGTSSIMAASPNLIANRLFDPVNDFVPISLIATIENILVVHPGVRATNVTELVAFAKANPGKLTYASSGIGSTYHLGAELFASQTGIQMTHVPYKGAAPAILQRLQKEIGDAVNSADYREKLATLDMQPRASTSQELAGNLKSDLAKWAKVVKDAGIKPE